MQLKDEDGEAGNELRALLKRTAEVYRTLMSNAQAAGIAVPPEAVLGGASATGKGPPRWSEFAAVDADDWEDFEDEGGCHCMHGQPHTHCAGRASPAVLQQSATSLHAG